jgi:uncharacterized protein (DUF305 family)
MRRIAISLSLVGILGVGAAACGSSNDSSSGVPATTAVTAGTATPTTMPAGSVAHNDADVTFAQKMIPHHQQALAMATMAMDAKAGASAEVKALATKISAAQTPEIEMMQGWLDTWTVPMTASTDMHGAADSTSMTTTMGGMGDGDGMMSDADMHNLSTATGPAFDKLWLTGMIAHHQGAITMATTEQQAGTNPDAIKLADSIATGQAKEVTEMQQLLGAG